MVREMPWFTELHAVLKQPLPDNVNYRHVYLALDALTTPKYGMRAEFLGIANRRRIWRACEQIADTYSQRLAHLHVPGPPNWHDVILDAPDTPPSWLSMPIVGLPYAKTAETKFIAKPCIRSLEDLKYRPAIFTARWNRRGDLVGLGIAVGRDSHMISIEDGSGLYSGILGGFVAREERRLLRSDDWIIGMVLVISALDVTEDEPHVAVKGITV